jgi:hypothetical protein
VVDEGASFAGDAAAFGVAPEAAGGTAMRMMFSHFLHLKRVVERPCSFSSDT